MKRYNNNNNNNKIKFFRDNFIQELSTQVVILAQN